MDIVRQISVKDFIHVFFACYLYGLLVLGKCVHDINLANFLSQTADHIFVVIVPPWYVEWFHFILNIALGIPWWDMKVSAIWAEVLITVSLLVNVGLWHLRFWVEPVAYIGSSVKGNWVTKWASVVFSDQFSQIKYFIKL